MSDTTETCPRCGAPLPAGTGPDGCPRCLLRMGIAGAEGEDPAPLIITESGAEQLAPPPPIEELAPLLPQLEILRVVGQGGMGVVYEARQKNLDRPVALKLLPALRGDPSFEERFAREARALASLSHPGIVGVYDFGRAGDRPFLLMEFVDGVDLRKLIRSGEATPKQALDLVGQICDALQYAHEEGVVHRDIKPENVLVDRKGRVKITDFGLAKLLRPDAGRITLTHANQVVGTPHYMAPEQIDRPLEVDHRADIYSLGVVFYELLTGDLPIGRFQPPSNKAQVDPRIDEVVLKTLESEPQRRYQAVSEVKTDVDAIGSGVAQPAPAATPKRGRGSKKKNRSVWYALGAVLVLVGCLPIALVVMTVLFAASSRHASSSPDWAQPESYAEESPISAEIRATEAIDNDSSRLQELGRVAARYELTFEEQKLLVDAIYEDGWSDEMADAMIVLIETQGGDVRLRRHIKQGIDAITWSDDQDRVLQAFDRVPGPTSQPAGAMEAPPSEAAPDDGPLSHEQVIETHDDSCQSIRTAAAFPELNERRDLLLTIARGAQLGLHAQHCFVAAASEMPILESRVQLLETLLQDQPVLAQSTVSAVAVASEDILSITLRAQVMKAVFHRQATGFEFLDSPVAPGAAAPITEPPAPDPPAPADPLAHVHDGACALIRAAEREAFGDDRAEILEGVSRKGPFGDGALRCYLRVVRDSGDFDKYKKDALLALIENQVLDQEARGLIADVVPTLAFESSKDELLEALLADDG